MGGLRYHCAARRGAQSAIALTERNFPGGNGLESSRDRRHVELTLTADGQQKADLIAGIEEQMYEFIDTAGAGHDTGAVIAYLRALVDDQPAGLAVQRRAEWPGPPRHYTPWAR